MLQCRLSQGGCACAVKHASRTHTFLAEHVTAVTAQDRKDGKLGTSCRGAVHVNKRERLTDDNIKSSDR